MTRLSETSSSLGSSQLSERCILPLPGRRPEAEAIALMFTVLLYTTVDLQIAQRRILPGDVIVKDQGAVMSSR